MYLFSFLQKRNFGAIIFSSVILKNQTENILFGGLVLIACSFFHVSFYEYIYTYRKRKINKVIRVLNL